MLALATGCGRLSNNLHRAQEDDAAVSPILLATVLLVSGLLLWRFDLFQRAQAAGSWARRSFPWLEILAAGLVFVVSVLWLAHVNGGLSVVGEERERALMTGPGCFDSPCQTVGAGSSVVLNNGAVWPELEDITRHYGGGERWLQRVMLGLMALGNGLMFLTVSRYAGPAAAAPASAFVLALLGSHRYLSPVMDATSSFFFAAVAVLALLVFVLTDSIAALVTATVFVAHAFNVHVSAVSLLPAFTLLPMMAGKSARTSVAWAAAGFFGSCAATSFDALVANWVTLGNTHLRAAFLVTTAVLLGVGLGARPLYRRASKPTRVAVALALLLAPFAAGAAFLAGIGHPVKAGYVQPVIVPLALASAGLLAWPTRWLPRRVRSWSAFVVPMAAGVVALCWVGFDPS
jgi:hypothetical protein